MEVFGDNNEQMLRQALIINSWGKNIYVKIPVVNSKGKFSGKVINKLSKKGIKLNITAVYTVNQVKKILNNINKKSKTIISIFSGRMSDVGKDPIPIIKESVRMTKKMKKVEILWASTREVLNIFQAENTGCQIITVPNEILKKLSGIGVDLEQLSLETVSTFYKDATIAGYTIKTKKSYKK